MLRTCFFFHTCFIDSTTMETKVATADALLPTLAITFGAIRPGMKKKLLHQLRRARYLMSSSTSISVSWTSLSAFSSEMYFSMSFSLLSDGRLCSTPARVRTERTKQAARRIARSPRACKLFLLHFRMCFVIIAFTTHISTLFAHA